MSRRVMLISGFENRINLLFLVRHIHAKEKVRCHFENIRKYGELGDIGRGFITLPLADGCS